MFDLLCRFHILSQESGVLMSQEELQNENSKDNIRINDKNTIRKKLSDVVGILGPIPDQLQKEINYKTFDQLREEAKDSVAQNYSNSEALNDEETRRGNEE